MVPSWSLVPKLMSIDHPWRMNKFDVGQSSLSWNSCGSLKRTMPTPLRSAKSRYASNESTLTPLEINSRLFTTYMFRFPSHHVFTWQATTWKKNPLQVSSLSFQVPLSSDGGIVCDHITLDAPAKQTTNSLPDQHLMPCSEFCQPKICHVDVGSVFLELFED